MVLIEYCRIILRNVFLKIFEDIRFGLNGKLISSNLIVRFDSLMS